MRLVFILLSVSVVSSAQSGVAKEDLSPSKFTIDCASFASSPGCKSYDEMLEGKDQDVLAVLQGGNTLVCFNETADKFVLIYFAKPPETEYVKTANNMFPSTSGFVSYASFSQGLRDTSHISFGKWRRILLETDFESDPNSNVRASVDDAEIAFSYSFTNLSETKTNYSIQIRRSTLRFTENYQFPQTSKQKGQDRVTETGHCAEFK